MSNYYNKDVSIFSWLLPFHGEDYERARQDFLELLKKRKILI